MKKELPPKIELSREDKKSLVFLAKRNKASIGMVEEEDRKTRENEERIAEMNKRIAKTNKREKIV